MSHQVWMEGEREERRERHSWSVRPREYLEREMGREREMEGERERERDEEWERERVR